MADVTDGENSKRFIENWDLDELFMLVEGIGTHCKFFMRFIGVKEETIKSDFAHYAKHRGMKELATDILVKYMHSQEDRMTWQEVENALNCIQKNELIKTIKRELKLPTICGDIHDGSKCQVLNCSGNALAVVALQIKNNWKELAKNMSISREEISTIEEDNQSYPVEERAYQFLWGLNQQLPVEDVLTNVRNAMLKCMSYRNYKEICSNICKKNLNQSLQSIFTEESPIEMDEQVHYISYSYSECDFYIVSHSSVTEQNLRQKTIDKFDEKIFEHRQITKIRTSIEPGSKKWLKLLDFAEQHCKRYIERYYGNLNFFSFNYELDDEHFVAGFKHFLKKRGAGFMIKDYNLMKYVEFSKMGEYVAENYHFSKFESSHKMDHIGVEERYRAIYFIKKSNAIHLKDLIQDIKDSDVYVHMFFMLHKKKLIGKISSLVSIIVIPTEAKDLIDQISKSCSSCSEFIITEEKFKEFSDKTWVAKLSHLTTKIREKINKDSFNELKYEFADIFGFMASQDAKLVPCLTELDVQKQIENTKILFNPTQLQISNSKDKRVLLIGDYGSGKTLVGRSKIQKLSLDQDPHCSIHYINFGTSSDLTNDMRRFAESLHNKQKIKCGSVDCFQGKNKLVTLMKSIKSKHKENEKVHLIFDEVSINDWSHTDVLEFMEILNEPQFIDSYCVIMCKPMQTERSVIQDSIVKAKSKSYEEQIEMLTSKLGFKKKELDEIFRNTNKVEKLSKFTKKTLENQSNKFFQETSKIEVKDIVKNEEKDECQSSTYISKENSLDSIRVESDLDLSFKFAESLKEGNSDDYIESLYKYCNNGKALHNIPGNIPLLYSPFYEKDDYHDHEKMYLVSLCLKNIKKHDLFIGIHDITLIHFEAETPTILHNALGMLKGKHKFKNLSIKSVVETQGCEYKNVIIYVSTAEYHLRHYLVEAMTRCMVNLIFIVIKDREKERNFVSEMIQKWVDEDLVRVVSFEKLKYKECVLQDLRKNHATKIQAKDKQNQIIRLQNGGLMERFINVSKIDINDSQKMEQQKKEASDMQIREEINVTESMKDDPHHCNSDSQINQVLPFDSDVWKLFVDEICEKILEWKLFGNVLQIPDSELTVIENKKRVKEERIIECMKYVYENMTNDNIGDWHFWRQHLLHLDNGKDIVKNIESSLPIKELKT